MGPLDLVRLSPLMEMGAGRPELRVGLIDGPVVTDHPGLAGGMLREIPGGTSGHCALAESLACRHGTFVAGILSGKRGSSAPAICPGCTLLVRPVFPEKTSRQGGIPGATPRELAAAIVDCIDAGARVINLSLALTRPPGREESELREALDRAMGRGVIVVAASGNQGSLGGTVITRHPWVIPVVACDREGRPVGGSNLGRSVGGHGLRAPGDGVASLGTAGELRRSGGTSVAAPFVTGAVALLWSVFASASAPQLKLAITQAFGARRRSVVPPLLDAWGAYELMTKTLP